MSMKRLSTYTKALTQGKMQTLIVLFKTLINRRLTIQAKLLDQKSNTLGVAKSLKNTH